MGIELDTDDAQSYVSSAESFVKDAQEYITNSGYELKMAVGIVFGEDDPLGSGILEDSNTLYQSLYQRLVPLQNGLNEVLKDITENGFDLPKQEIVDNYHERGFRNHFLDNAGRERCKNAGDKKPICRSRPVGCRYIPEFTAIYPGIYGSG